MEEELEELDVSQELSSDLTFEEIIDAVSQVATGKIANPEQTGKLLYENKNTDWVEQVAATSQNYQKRISGLIDFHIKNLRSKNTVAVEDRVEGFDIRDYAK